MKHGHDRLQLFVPEGDRESKATPVDLHDRWVIRLLQVCTELFGGATSYGRGVGAWKSGEDYYWDRVTVIEVWADRKLPDHARNTIALTEELMIMGRALRQKTVGCIINGRLKLFNTEATT